MSQRVFDFRSENLELKTCQDEVSLWQRRDDSILAELNAHISNIITTDDKVSSLDKLYTQDMNSVILSHIDDFLYLENITDHEIEGSSS